jgi:branched-chain amino acid transport system permease protein
LSTLGVSSTRGDVRGAGLRWSWRSVIRILPYGLFILPPFVLPGEIDIWVNPLLIGIAGAVGLNVLTGTTGLISLGQAGFLAVGAYTSVAISVTAGLSFPVAVIASIVSGMLIGAIVGVSTSRLRGLYAVISTLALQYVVVYIGTRYEESANNTAAFVLPTAKLGSWRVATNDRWYLVLAVLAAGYVALYQRLLRSHAGRALEVIGDRDHVAPMLGINVARYEMYAWMLSGAAVALVGCVQAFYLSAVSPDFFTLTIAIQYFAMIVVGGRGSPLGSVIGAALLITLPFELQGLASHLGGSTQAAKLSDYDTIAYGALLIIFLVVAPDGLVGRLRTLGTAITHRLSGTHPASDGIVTAHESAAVAEIGLRPAASAAEDSAVMAHDVEGAEAPTSAGTEVLHIEGLTVGYRGGSIALRDVSMDVAAGEVVAVLGPNGAGKTTLLRSIAGFAPDEPGMLRAGTILFDGRPVQNVAAFRRAMGGIVLVPEREKVFPGLTVLENIELASPNRRDASSMVEEVLEFFPALRPRVAAPAVLLSGGERQMLAIGRGFMLRPRLLLLDETTLGLAPIIAEQVMRHIGQIARNRNTSVILVEQNVALAELVADRYYTLQNGAVVDSAAFHGATSRQALIEEYLGPTASP